MTTRRWMVAVAIVGLVMGWLAARIHLDQQAVRRLSIGAWHHLKEYECRALPLRRSRAAQSRDGARPAEEVGVSLPNSTVTDFP